MSRAGLRILFAWIQSLTMSLAMMWFRGLRRAGGHHAFWLGLPLLLYLPTVTGPFSFDDLMLVLRAEAHSRGESPSPRLFCFAGTRQQSQELRDRGTFPWWSPEGRISFFRPLAEWSFCLDVLLFGRNTLGYRIVSLAWFAIALLCVHKLFVTACGDSARAGVATFFFGISQTVTQPATFICNRADLLVAVGVSIAATAYWKATSRQRTLLVFIAAASFAFALLSKEMAIGLAGVVVLHEIITRRSRARVPASATVIALILGLMAVVYVAYFAATRPWHVGLGGDQEPSNFSFLARAPKAILLYSAVWSLGFQTDVLMLMKTGPWLVIAIGSAGLCFVAIMARYVARMARNDRATLFFVLWAVVFVLVGLMTPPAPRVLCVATIGWAYLIAGLMTAPVEDRATSPLWLRQWLFTTCGMINLCCAIGTVVTQNRLELELQHSLNEYVEAQGRPLANGDSLLIAEARGPLELILMPERLEFSTGLRDVAVTFLTPPGADGHIEREGDRTLVFSSTHGDLLDKKLYELSQGQERKRRVGEKFATRDFTAEIRELTRDGRVTLLAFQFSEPLSSPRLHFYPPELALIAHGGK
jgi:hypothetical protein